MNSTLNKIVYNKNAKILEVIKTFGEFTSLTNNRAFGLLVNNKKKCIASFTDGDIRRHLSIKGNKLTDKIYKASNKNFHYLHANCSYNNKIRGFEKLLKKNVGILTLPLIDKKKFLIGIVNYDDVSNFIKFGQKFNFKSNNRITVSVPTRLSFVGGGYDFSWNINELENHVLTATLNKKIYVSISLRKDKKIKIINLKENISYFIKNFENTNKDLVASILKTSKINFGLNISIDTDVEKGSGLGGSSALTIGILSALELLKKKDNKLDLYNIANTAYKAERIEFGNEGGWQDYFATAFEGFKWIKMNNKDIEVTKINLKDDILNELNYHMLSFKYGNQRDSSLLHKNNLTKKINTKNFLKYLKKSKIIANQMKKNLVNGKLFDFYNLLDKSWKIKTKINWSTSSKNIFDIYDAAKKKGAISGKLLGAGQSGYFVFFAKRQYHNDIIKVMTKMNLKKEDLKLENNGIKFWKSKI